MTGVPAPREQAERLTRRIAVLREEVGRLVIGQQELIDDLLVGMLAGGHVLLEGLPGLGKTLLVKSMAQGLGLPFSRIQFTPDLMPADVTGTTIVDEAGGQRRFRFQQGPLFASLVLADEINRATPKTQSALLEAMQEGSVTMAGTSHPLPRPFHVVATQNPIELEGTYPLPEAQLDRFLFKLVVATPPVGEVVRVLDSTTGAEPRPVQAVLAPEQVLELQELARQVLCGEHLLRYVAELLHATHPDDPDSDERTRRMVRYGASVRAGQAAILGAKVRALLDGRPAIAQEDIDACLLPALRHRIVLTFEAEAEQIGVADLLPEWRERAQKRMR